MHTENGDRMKRVIVDHYGGPEVLRIVEGKSLDRVQASARQGVAAGVSHRCHAPRRLVSRRAQAPFTPGYELVGVVEELGPGCSAFAWETVSAR